VVAFLGLGGIVAAYMAMRLLGIGPVGTLVASGVMDERDRIVLATFVNRTADSTLGETVTELLRIDLMQSPTVSLLDRAQIARVLARMEQPQDAVLDEALAIDVATREGSKGVVTGEVRSVGSGFVVSSSLRSVTGEVLWVGRESASDASKVIEAIDNLSASLRARIGESLRTIRADAPLAAVTTRSTEALRKYAQGDRANNAGEYTRAIRLLGEAIEVDSTFAMAYRKLGVVLQNQNQELDRSRAALTRGFELRDRLTDRERYLMEAAYYSYVEDSVEASNDAYLSLLERYPDDHIALNNLAVNYRGAGRMEEAADLYVRAIRVGNAPAVTYTNAIPTLYDVDQPDTALDVLGEFAEDYAGHPQLPQLQANVAAARFDYVAARQYAEQLVDAQGVPVFNALGLFNLASYAMIEGRPEEALRAIEQAFRFQEEHELGFVNQPWELFGSQVDAVMTLRLFGGREEAIAVLDRARASEAWRDTEPANRNYTGFITLYAEAGDLETAHALVAEYRETVDQTVQESVGDRVGMHSARGYIALTEGQPVEALLEFRAARDLLSQCRICGLVEVGIAMDAAGMADSAIATYEQYVDTPYLGRDQQDNVNLFQVLRRLGELYEQAGNRQKAVEYYDRFVDLWANAEPALQPQIDQVRERLANLAAR
jgi:tetratricopeptide (TPR) repeat protein